MFFGRPAPAAAVALLHGAPHSHALRVRGASTALPSTRRTRGCSWIRPGAIYPRTGVGHGAAARRHLARDDRYRRRPRSPDGGALIAERAEIRLGDLGRRAGRGRRRSRARSHWSGSRGFADHRHSARPTAGCAGARDGHHLDPCSTSPTPERQAVLDATHGEGADVVIEAAGSAAAISEGLDLARAGWPVRDRRALHRRRRARSTRISRSSLSISRSARMLGQRGPALPSRAVHPGAAPVDPLQEDRRAAVRTPPAERRPCGRRGDAHPEGAGGSVAVMRHTKIIATLGPSSTVPACSKPLVAGALTSSGSISHGTHESHGRDISRRPCRRRARSRHIAILQDLSSAEDPPPAASARRAADRDLRKGRAETARRRRWRGEPARLHAVRRTGGVGAARRSSPAGRREDRAPGPERSAGARDRRGQRRPSGEHKGINAPGVAPAGGRDREG